MFTFDGVTIIDNQKYRQILDKNHSIFDLMIIKSRYTSVIQATLSLILKNSGFFEKKLLKISVHSAFESSTETSMTETILRGYRG